MLTVIGLGNPGAAYENTRHNAGRIALADFAHTHGLSDLQERGGYVAHVAEGMVGGTEVRLAFPITYMNESGGSAKKLVADMDDPKRLVVVYDDLDLPLGSIKVSYGRGDGGHNGIASIIKALGTKEFVRIRVGIAPVSLFGKVKRPKGDRASTYVLGQFSKRERAKVEAAGEKVTRTLETLITEGLEKTLSTCN